MKFVLVGSSIFEQWHTASEAFPEHTVVNRAVSGTTTGYWLTHLPAVLNEEMPDAVCLYCGSNDLNQDVPRAEIVENITKCSAILQDHPSCPQFAYFSIMKAPQKKGKWDLIDNINATVRSRLPAGDVFVDLNKIFFVDGRPVDSL